MPRRRGDGDGNTRSSTEDAISVAVASVATVPPEFRTFDEAVQAMERKNGPHTDSWTYTDESGKPVGLIVRWDRPGGGKYIRPVSLTANGSSWRVGGMPQLRPLYRLPDLRALAPGARVFITEGEKAADAARALGLAATTSPHGAKSAAKADWSSLAGLEVVILPDHDDAGARYAHDVSRLALAARASSVRIAHLSVAFSLPAGGDLADVLERCLQNGRAWAAAHGGTVEDSIAAEMKCVCQSLDGLVEETPLIERDEPEPDTIGAFQPFPTDALPEPVRPFVIQGAAAIGCGTSYIALPLLSALAAVIGNTCRIQLKRGWTEPANLWTAIVGESGTMKTPAFKLALKAIRQIQDAAFKEFETAQAAWKLAQARYEVQLAEWKKRASKGLDETGGEPPQEPAPPVPRRYVISDTTVEALAPILLGNPRGLLLARDELAGWLGSFDRYAKGGKAGADISHWLSMHNGEELTVDRKTGKPPTIHIPSASISISGGIQPGTLARALGREHHENGLLARLLFAMPPRTKKMWTEDEVDQCAEAAVAALFKSLLDLTPQLDERNQARPRTLFLTPEGKAAWVKFYNEHAREQVDLSGDEAAAWSKLEGYAARLALVVHLVRRAAGDPTLSDPVRVDASSIASGVTLSRWFGNEARRVYAALSETDDGRELRQLVDWIRSKGGVVTARDLTRGPRAYRGSSERAHAALCELVAAGFGRWEIDDHGGGRGRPLERFRLTPERRATEAASPSA